MDDSTKQRISELRTKGLTAKEIAKALKLRPAEVTDVVRGLAGDPSRGPTSVELEPRCLVSATWRTGLTAAPSPTTGPDLLGLPQSAVRQDGDLPQLITVAASRPVRGGRFEVAWFLVDPCCLGVKSVNHRKHMESTELESELKSAEESQDCPFEVVPIGAAREIVFGAVEYARSLGFEPHPRFAEAARLLGPWQGPSRIRFGFFGKPYYVAGPRDDSRAVMATLTRTVGEGNFDALTVSGL